MLVFRHLAVVAQPERQQGLCLHLEEARSKAQSNTSNLKYYTIIHFPLMIELDRPIKASVAKHHIV